MALARQEKAQAVETLDAGAPKASPAIALDAPTRSANGDPSATQIRTLLHDAIISLWTILERERLRTNARAALRREAAPIIARREGIVRRFSTGTPGDERHLTLLLSVPATGGHITGGVYIASSKTPPFIYLVPRIENGRACWTVAATGDSFTAQTASDLFSAAFDGDEDAARRLAPLAGQDLFNTPWS